MNAFISVSKKIVQRNQRAFIAFSSSQQQLFSRQRIISFSSSISSIHPTSEEDNLYEELKLLSKEIRENDALYYKPGLIPKLSDEEYDALTVREADICQKYPNLLERIEKESGLGKAATRYGGRVGLVLPGKDKLVHLENSPMQSLENAMTGTHVIKWLNRVRKILTKNADLEDNSTFEIIAEPKMDGLSLSLRYELISSEDRKYSLKWAATRGDGTKGEDVTEAVLSMNKVPRIIMMDDSLDEIPQTIEVRGEIVLPRSKFEKLKNHSSINHKSASSNDDYEIESVEQNSFSNARNAASGILMRRKSNDEQTKDEIESTKRLRSLLRFYAYACAFANKEGIDDFHVYEDGIKLRSLLSNLGFLIPEPVKVFKMTLRTEKEFDENDCVDLFQFHEEVMNTRNSTTSKSLFDFEVDGAVYKVSSSKYRDVLGSSSRTPRWAIAHKFPAQSAVTKLLGIEVQIGRTGSLTPVAVLEPVDLGGVIVTRASLHNFQYARSLLEIQDHSQERKSPKVEKGAPVLISRAGDVIPQVIRRLTNESSKKEEIEIDLISLETPSVCPSCGSPTVFQAIGGKSKSNSGKSLENTTELTMGQVLRCSGPQLLCQPQAIGALAHTFSRSCIDVAGLSEARLQQLYDERLIKVPADLFDILNKNSNLLDSITNLNGWGEKSAYNLKNQVQNIAQKGVPLPKFINSLGIRHVGVVSSSIIASMYGSCSKFLDALEHAANAQDGRNDHPFPELIGVKNVGPVIIDSMFLFAKNKELLESSKRLAASIPVHDVKLKQHDSNEIKENEIDIQSPLEGKTVVFTGSLPNGMSRAVAQDFAVDLLGAKATPSSVSSSTGLVIIGEKGGKKAVQAKELGIPTMAADEFVDLVNRFNTFK